MLNLIRRATAYRCNRRTWLCESLCSTQKLNTGMTVNILKLGF